MANTTKRTTSADLLKSPRVRFNWGFWDGLAGAWSGRIVSGHYDQVYANGVVAGKRAAVGGEVPAASDAAWTAYHH